MLFDSVSVFHVHTNDVIDCWSTQYRVDNVNVDVAQEEYMFTILYLYKI